MKLVSWNVNGLRACLEKGFLDFFKDSQADVFSLQEIKLQEGQLFLDLEGYHQFWNYAEKKGYSGTAVFSRIPPKEHWFGLRGIIEDREGRVVTLEFDRFFLVNVYTPNSQRELARLDYRMEWEEGFRKYLLQLDKNKPVILCGDLNVAHREIDLKNPATNRRNAGFTDEEREKISLLLDSCFVDSFRYFYPDKTDAYTWWSYMGRARENNTGWRIDYFIVSERLKENLRDSLILPAVLGSDHCPVALEIDLE